MKTTFKFLVWIILVIALFFISLVFLFTHTGFSQASNLTSNLEKLQLTFPVDFTEKEKKFINSLSQTDLEKLIRVIKLIAERNIQNANNSKINQFFANPTSGTQKPTTYSNNPSPQTPYYNPQTGQYQSAPISGGGSSGNPGINNNVSGGQPNPYSNNLPFSGQPTSAQPGLQPQLPQPLSPAAALVQGLNQGLNQQLSGGSVDLDKLNVLPQCKINYGVVQRGRCLDMEGTESYLKETTALACSAIGKPIGSASARRGSQKCGNSGVGDTSQHNTGKAIDVSQIGLTSAEKQKVYEVFRKRGYFGVGCYGLGGHVHFDNGTPRRWYEGPCPHELKLAGY